MRYAGPLVLGIALVVGAMGVTLAQRAAAGWSAAGEVAYEARDALASWRGTAPIAELAVDLDPDDLRTLRLLAIVRPAAFRSGNVLRDATARRDVFEAEAHPEAHLIAAPVPATVRRSIAAGESTVLTLDAQLTLHGVTRGYRIDVTLERIDAPTGATEVRAETSFVVSLEAHGMRRPTLLGLVTNDAVRVSATATATLDPAPTPTTP